MGERGQTYVRSPDDEDVELKMLNEKWPDKMFGYFFVWNRIIQSEVKSCDGV